MNHTTNPFIVKAYLSKELFCDRENELNVLHRNFNNGINTTIISPRKMGKSGLIHRFFDDLNFEKDLASVYIDIYATLSLKDFIKHIAEAIMKRFPEKTKTGRAFMKFLKSLRPVISFDPFTGQPQIQINFQTEYESAHTIQNLFQFLDAQNIKIICAFDEFQQISKYPEKNVEALLRTHIQSLKNVFFIFCGSNKSMMSEIFTSANRPFFASTRLLYLDKIETTAYKKFIQHHFGINGKQISEEAIESVLFWTKRHTFYTQTLCNVLFSMHHNKVSVESVKEAMSEILTENEPYFFQYRQFLTPAQWNYLIAVAKEEEVTQITSQKFISKYHIGTPANSKRIMKSLLEKELILEILSEKETCYRIYDVFFGRWLQTNF
ncbi:MAG: Archaeal ATPase [Bacteroidetes bacterium ADurb.Bin408]|nr:MAG: Archaeal ATPase [Bacteroidetes bacterium ADurb.Bin408]